MNEKILQHIANYSFVATEPLFDVCYVDWQTLGRLACTCQCLRTHLDGLRTLYEALPSIHNGEDVELPSRWRLSAASLRAAKRERPQLFVPLGWWFGERMRHPELALPIPPLQPSSDREKARTKNPRAARRDQQRQWRQQQQRRLK